MLEASRMAAGPKRHPGLYEVPVSKGTPSTAKSLPEQSRENGRRWKGRTPQNRGEASELTGMPMMMLLVLRMKGDVSF